MSALKVYSDDNPTQPLVSATGHDEIARHLSAVGVRFEQWQTNAEVRAGDSQEAVMAAYRADIDRLVAEQGYQAVDVISLDASQEAIKPQVPELRKKFLSEHRHSEDEVRFFCGGQGPLQFAH
jgi:1,2-dihydroxy-3-keto-5-methylthiopentene dioxygenase